MTKQLDQAYEDKNQNVGISSDYSLWHSNLLKGVSNIRNSIMIDKQDGLTDSFNDTSQYNLTFDQNATAYNNLTKAPMQFGGAVRISLYTVIFLLSVVGNTLVLLTLIQNRRMRTVTNVFLLNLSISDLLLAVFCMPFTLVPTLLQDFIFGATMCVLIRYVQGELLGFFV